jgi:hypothetical protein
MKPFIVIALLIISLASYSQNNTWRAANDPLRYPKPLGQAEGGIAWVERYEKVPCYYITTIDTITRTGYKLVYTHNGYYIDTRETLGIFYDEKGNRIKRKKVKAYMWKD